MTEFINRTPWETEPLKAFILSKLSVVSLPPKIEVVNHRPVPRKAELARLCRILAVFPYCLKTNVRLATPESLTVELASPNRVARRTATLDRLALVDRLESNEVLLPNQAAAELVHALEWYQKVCDGSTTSVSLASSHYDGRCERYGGCKEVEQLQQIDHHVIIKGNTKTKLGEQVSMEELASKLLNAEESVTYCQKRLDAAVKRRDKLKQRVQKAIAEGHQ